MSRFNVDGSLRDPDSGHGVTGLLGGFAALGDSQQSFEARHQQ